MHDFDGIPGPMGMFPDDCGSSSSVPRSPIQLDNEGGGFEGSAALTMPFSAP